MSERPAHRHKDPPWWIKRKRRRSYCPQNSALIVCVHSARGNWVPEVHPDSLALDFVAVYTLGLLVPGVGALDAGEHIVPYGYWKRFIKTGDDRWLGRSVSAHRRTQRDLVRGRYKGI